MKSAVTVLLSLVIILCAASPAPAEGSDLISPEAMQSRIEWSPYLNLFDVRDAEKYDAGHLENAVSFPLDTLRESIQKILDGGFSYMSVEIVVYGETEEQGVKAAEILRGLGFTNVKRLESISVWTGKLDTLEDENRLLGGLDTVDIYGQAVSGELLRGFRLTMVNVWATYCNPCISEMSDLGRLARDMKDQGVQIIGLLSDAVDASLAPVEDKVALAREIAEATGADYPHLLPSVALFRKVLGGVSAVPTTFFVDETGMLVAGMYVGARNYDSWKRIIDNVLEQLP